jgi:hypothetical protein
MESTLPNFLLFRHFPLIRWLVFSMPPWLTMITAPKMKGLLDLQKVSDIVPFPRLLANNIPDAQRPNCRSKGGS